MTHSHNVHFNEKIHKQIIELVKEGKSKKLYLKLQKFFINQLNIG